MPPSAELQPFAVMDGACYFTIADPASSRQKNEDSRDGRTPNNFPAPTVYNDEPGTLSSALDTNEYGPPREMHTSDQIIAAVGEAMEMDIADSALPGSKSNPFEVYPPKNKRKMHEEEEERTAPFQTDVDVDASSKAIKVEEGAAEESPMEGKLTFDTTQGGFFETEAMLCVEKDIKELRCGDHSAQFQSEGLANTGFENVDASAPSRSGELDSQGDQPWRQLRAPDAVIPADVMVQSRQVPRPPNPFSIASTSGTVVPDLGLYPDLRNPEVQAEQPMASSARSHLPGLD